MPSYVIALKRKHFNNDDLEPAKKKRPKVESHFISNKVDSDKNCESYSASATTNLGFASDDQCGDRDGCLSSFSASPLSIPDFEFRYEACSPIRPISRSPSLLTEGNGATNGVQDVQCSDIVPTQSPDLPDIRKEKMTSPGVGASEENVKMEASNTEIDDETSPQSPMSPYNEIALVTGIVKKIQEEEMSTTYSVSSGKKPCTVCGADANGMYFGAIVCLPCKSFFIRCTKEGEPTKLKCQNDINCGFPGPIRHRCQYCRFQRCLVAGMWRKEKPEIIEPAFGQSLCRVCGDIANGIHFGVNTCEGCKKFFRRGLKEAHLYSCKEGQVCPINPRSRNACRYCRYMKCVSVGMSREAIKMGRPRKSSDGEQKDVIGFGRTNRRNSGDPHMYPQMKSSSSMFNLSEREQDILNKLRLTGNSMPQLSQHGAKSNFESRRKSLVTSSYESLARNPRAGMKMPLFGSQESLSLSPRGNMPYSFPSQKESQYSRGVAYQQSLSAPGGLLNSRMHSNDANQHFARCEEPAVKTEQFDKPCVMQKSNVQHKLTAAGIVEHLSMNGNVFPGQFEKSSNARSGRLHSGIGFGKANQVVFPHQGSDMCCDIVDEIMYESSVHRSQINCETGTYQRGHNAPDVMDFQENWMHNSMGPTPNSYGQSMKNKLSPNGVALNVPNFQTRAPQFKPRETSMDKMPALMESQRIGSVFDDVAVSRDTQRYLDTVVESYREMVTKCDEASLSLDLRKSTDQGKMASVGVMRTIQQGIIPNCEAQLWFATRIPGFCNLCREDQVVLLKYGSFQMGMVWASLRMYDTREGRFRNFDSVRLPPNHPMELFQTQLYSMAEKLRSLDMDEREASMLCTLVLLSGDYLELKDTSKIHKQYTALLKALDEYIFRKLDRKSNRLDDLTSFISKLRHMGIWYTHLMRYIDMESKLSENAMLEK